MATQLETNVISVSLDSKVTPQEVTAVPVIGHQENATVTLEAVPVLNAIQMAAVFAR